VGASIVKRAADPLARLFWKAQIGLLRSCPPLCGLVFRYSYGSANSRKVWMKTLLRMAARVPGAAIAHWYNRRDRRTVLSYVTIFVTSRCTLNCDKCIAHIPDLKRRGDVSLQDLFDDVQALLRCVDGICVLSLSGGETFLHPGLGKLLRVCAASDKIEHLSVTTNGTVLPDDALLAALRETGATVRISRYAQALQPQAEELKRICNENRVPCTHTSSAVWRDMGAFGQLKTGSEKRRFEICVQQLNRFLSNGKLYFCCASAFLTEEGLLADNRGDYIDLRATNPVESRKRLQKMPGVPLCACSYCLGNTYKTPKVPVAVQREGAAPNKPGGDAWN